MYPEITTEELQERLENGEKLNLVDVREQDEWEAGHIGEARLIPLSEIQERADEFSRDGEQVYIICRSGGRSGKACEFLQAGGLSVVNVKGGMLAWQGDVVQGA
ncbi:rhodanese-like domain-containing protein [Paenibacillus protaetiae]|uniref:Rhodanese-like domain-containing protein n=1 Tax=Paenibacillus protaetiae TaxID=2509456 RepID=A0A4P6ERY1_9BACL|nr:rhodanese-like domain-containing protein [Paenibacillus protaetiae]QAY65682.1 rhodanese-like domain-containing protein [Paenibacillus protaetiae]